MLKVSIIVPSYNHSSFVCATIESIMNQTAARSSYELIVVDDCSPDDSVQKIRCLQEKYDFVFIESEVNTGVNGAIERALEVCSGAYISLIGSDDVLLPNKVADQVSFLLANDVDCVYSLGEIINEQGNVFTRQNLSEFERALNSGQGYTFCAVDDTSAPLLQSAMVKADLMREVSGLRKKFKSDDWVVLLYFLRGYKVGFQNLATFQYRIHPGNTHSNCWKTLPMRLEVPCMFFSVAESGLRNKSISNIFFSHSASLFREGKFLDGLRFLLAGLCFGFPLKKLVRLVSKRLVG